MFGRLTLGLIAAWAAIGAGSARAQGPVPGDHVPAHAWQAPSSGFVDPANYGYHPYANPYGPGPYYAPGPHGGPAPHVIEQLVPAGRPHRTYDHNPMLHLAIVDTLQDSWFRLEYLHYDVKAPGTTLLGAPVPGVDNPRERFFVTLPNDFVGIARVPDVSSVNFNNINGIRGTFGVPFKYFSAEVGFWGLEASTDIYQATDIPRTAVHNTQNNLDFIGTSLLTDGDPAGRIILYDRSYEFSYTSKIWATEANLFLNLQNPRYGWRVLPLFGFRHETYGETLRQRGVLDNSSGAFGTDIFGNPILFATPVENEIRSVVNNYRWSLQSGLRTELVDQYFTLGMEPKLGLGGNFIDARVTTRDLRDSPVPPIVDDGFSFDQSKYTLLAVTFDLALYAKWHVREWLDLKVGYNLLWMGNISRADNNIYYNDLGIDNPPAVGARKKTSDLWMQGLSVGGEIRFR